MVAGTGLQLRARAFFTALRVPDDARNGSNGQAMPGFAVHAKDADGVGHGEQFEIQRKGVNGKALLQECAGLKNVTHRVLPFDDVHSFGGWALEARLGQAGKNRFPGCELVPVATQSKISVSACFSHPPLEDLGGVIKREDVVITARSGARIQRVVGAAAKSHHGGHAFGGLEHAPPQLVDAHRVEVILGERITIDPRRLTP